GSWEWAPQRGSLIWSDKLYRILGYAPGEIAPSVEAFLARMHPEDRATRPGPAARLRRGVSPYEDEYRAVLPDGSIRHLRSRGEIRDGERLVGTIQDVTERVEAEAARRESEELFGIAFRNSPLAISIARLEDGRILDANEAFGRLVGCAREALIGRTSTEIGMVIDPADRRRLIERLGVEPALRDQDMPFRAASGEIRLARAAYSLIRVGGEACILFMGSDITDARRLEERAEAQARALALLKERERIEMELHDGVVQSLYAVGLGLLRWEQSPEADRTALRSARRDRSSTGSSATSAPISGICRGAGSSRRGWRRSSPAWRGSWRCRRSCGWNSRYRHRSPRRRKARSPPTARRRSSRSRARRSRMLSVTPGRAPPPWSWSAREICWCSASATMATGSTRPPA